MQVTTDLLANKTSTDYNDAMFRHNHVVNFLDLKSMSKKNINSNSLNL